MTCEEQKCINCESNGMGDEETIHRCNECKNDFCGNCADEHGFDYEEEVCSDCNQNNIGCDKCDISQQDIEDDNYMTECSECYRVVCSECLLKYGCINEDDEKICWDCKE